MEANTELGHYRILRRLGRGGMGEVYLALDTKLDGRHFVYRSDESGRNEIYERTFPEAGGKWQVSVDGGTNAKFSPRGDEIFFVRGDAQHAEMMAAPVVSDDPFRTGAPRPLFVMPRSESHSYDVSSDGVRFLTWQQEDAGDLDFITIVQNWFQEFAEPR